MSRASTICHARGAARLVLLPCAAAILAASAATSAPRADGDFESGRAITLAGTVGPDASPEAVRDSTSAWVGRALGPDLWRPGLDGFVVSDVRRLHGQTRVRLRQTHAGAPVVGGAIGLSVDGAGRASLLGSLVSGVAPGPPPGDGRVARRLALDAGGVSAPAWSADEQRWVAREGGADRWVWRVRLSGPRPWNERVAWMRDGERVPVRWEEAGAGASCLVHRDDGDDPLDEVTLQRLDGNGTELRGRWVDAFDELGHPPFADGGDFRVTPSNPDTTRFDEGNVYWYADHFLEDFLRPAGFEDFPQPLQIRCRVALWPPFSALTVESVVYLAPAQEFYFRDPAKARDMVTHEVQHAVTYAYGVRPGGPRREASALHEAVSDYFAAAWTNDPAVGEWVYFRFPDGSTRVDQPPDRWRWENYDSLAFGPNLPRSQWANAMILSAALWDLRNAVGAAADRLVLEALARVPEVPTWIDFANGLVAADHFQHAGRHQDAIVTALGRRGLGAHAGAVIAGPNGGSPGAELRWVSATASSGVVLASEWFVRRECRSGPCPEGWTRTGEGDTLHLAVDTDYQLRLVVTSRSGVRDTAERFVSQLPPRARIEGPDALERGAPGTWTAVVDGMGRYTVQWWQSPRVWGAPPVALGSGPQVSLVVDTSFVLTAHVEDRLGRRTEVQFGVRAVDTAPEPPPAGAAGDLALRLRHEVGSDDVEVAFELPSAGPARLTVLDAAGRRVGTILAEACPAGGHVVRWSARALPAGVHFVRLESAHGVRVRKFAVVR